MPAWLSEGNTSQSTDNEWRSLAKVGSLCTIWAKSRGYAATPRQIIKPGDSEGQILRKVNGILYGLSQL